MSKKKKSLAADLDMMERRHLINSEYQRGFMEGQRHALKAFAGLIDKMTEKHEQWFAADSKHSNLCRQEITIT